MTLIIPVTNICKLLFDNFYDIAKQCINPNIINDDFEDDIDLDKVFHNKKFDIYSDHIQR